MKQLILKISVYLVLMLLVLEVLVRALHLHNDMPTRFVDSDNINKWIPGQTGYTVYGNRVQNKAVYTINKSGYNSYREFISTEEEFEVALIGDSYIEGFHQDSYNSIGMKIENKMPEVAVFEFGHSSNDMADQLFLVYQNKELFDKVDLIIYYIKFNNDLDRDTYELIKRKPQFTTLRQSKLLEYTINIGLMDPIKSLVAQLRSLTSTEASEEYKKQFDTLALEVSRRNNFDRLIAKYDFDKDKSAIMLDSRITPKSFIEHLKILDIEVIDFATTFEAAGGHRKTTLIYDHHWNNYGRRLVADLVVEYIEKYKK